MAENVKATHESVTPVPKSRRPELLQTLDHACSQRPDLCRSTSLLSEVAAKEQEPSSRCDRVRPRRSVRDPSVDVAIELEDGRKADHEEGNGEEDPGDGEDVDGGLESEEAVPHERKGEEDL